MRRQGSLWIVALTLLFSAQASAQTIPEIARTKPANPIVRGIFRDVTTAPIETLAKESTLVVVGRLVWSKSYLTADEMNVLSDYSIVPEKVLLGTLPLSQGKPGTLATPTLTVYGGDVKIDGITVTVVDHNVELPRSGERFLLFLRPFGGGLNCYQVVRGAIFEIHSESMRALLKRADAPAPYGEVIKKSLSETTLQVAQVKR